MTDTVNLNTNSVNGTMTGQANAGYGLVPAANGTNTAASGSIFKSDPLSLFSSTGTSGVSSSSIFPGQSSSNFQGDLMMSGMDFDSLVYDPKTQTIMRDKTKQAQTAASAQNVSAAVQNSTNQQNDLEFTSQGQNQTTQNNTQGNLNFSELNNYLVKKDNTLTENSNIGKAGGAVIGFTAPIAEKLLSGAKSKTFLKGINWKQLAVTCPIIGLAGFGIGYVLDKVIDSLKKARPAQSEQPDRQPSLSQQQIQAAA